MIVFEYKACSYEYFMDRIQRYEIDTIMESLDYCVRSDWEMTREIVWSELATHSKTKIRPKDVMTFPWENKETKPTVREKMTDEKRLAMFERAENQKQALIAAGIL